MPTNSNAELGNKNWGMGPEFVILHLEHGDPWVYGAIINNVWSLTSNKQGGSYNNGLIQPFVNYNVPDGDGLYINISPLLTVNWTRRVASSGPCPLAAAWARSSTSGSCR